MVFGKLKGKKVRKAAVMCMKYLSTIIAPRKAKNAMQVIRMLEDHRLSSDAQGTLFENLGSGTLKLEGWDELADQKPDVLSFLDISVYELHIRDFNASDHAMETKFRGGYLTFTMQFQRSDSGCNTWWIFIWPSSSARICDCSIFQPNGHNQDTAGEKLMLAVSKDHIQVGMAANLRDIVLTDYEGRR
nr:pullulanase 1, chloroplastic-like isoform X3 [Ziziphus jujuba var. spinosa]